MANDGGVHASRKRRLVLAGKEMARKAIFRLPPSEARWLMFLAVHHRLPHLTHPTTFNEKVNWRVVFDRNPLLVAASSKVESKDLVEQWAPGVRVPTTLWHGVDLDELADVEADRRWVLKASHRSGCVLTGAAGGLDPAQLKERTRGWLDEAEYRDHALWAYGQVRREYILEEWIDELAAFPIDYKFFVFAGRIGMIQVDTGRFGDFRRNLYTADWTPLPYTFTHPRGPETSPPANFAEMCAVARDLGSRFDFIRVDLYNIDGRIYFGELTAYPAGGFSHWPRELDMRIGAYWQLPALRPAPWRLRWATGT